MPANLARAVVHGSECSEIPGACATGPVPPDERFEVTVRVKRKTPVSDLVAGDHAGTDFAKRRYMSREEYAARHAVRPEDFAAIEQFARDQGLAVTGKDAARRSIFLSGTAEQFEKAFGTKIEHWATDGYTYRGRTGSLTMPANVAALVEGVFGIDDRPVAIPHFQRLPSADAIGARAASIFTPPQLAKLYEFVAGADGTGQCIGIIELGGGYRTADLTAYFKEINLPAPKVTAIRVDGGRNNPTNANSADGEVMLDIEVAGGIAPKAAIAVYFAPNTDKGFLDAVTTAVHDKTNKPSVISISWGGPEKDWSTQAMTSFDQAFQTASALGVTICCAAGDAGSSDENPDDLAQNGQKPDGLAHADFPASSPFVLACGGTKLTVSGGTIKSEVVWDEDPNRSATGGGISDVFPVPSYQASTGIPPSANPGGRVGRGIPDVAGDADPNTGYQVRVDGQEMAIGGTSAVAPLWAGLIALLNQQLSHPVGFLNPILYAPKGGGACRDITSGNNGAYSAKPGWDACTGWGSPRGGKLLQLLKGPAKKTAG